MLKLRNHNIILPKYFERVKEKGSSLMPPALGVAGQGRLNTKYNNFPPKKIWAKPKQAGKKEGGLGEGIFARLPKRSPAALPVQSRVPQKSFLFLLEEKIGRAQNKKLRRKLFCGTASEASGGGVERQFRSKKVRAFSNKGHQTGLPDFLWGEAKECSPRLAARLARNWAVKSNGGTKSQETIFSEMRRFVITKLCIKINFYSNFCPKYPASRD